MSAIALDFYTQYGEKLSANQRDFGIIESAAEGHPPITVQAEPTAGTFGSRVLSFSAETRPLNYQIVFGHNGLSTAEYYEDVRKKLMTFFSVWNAPFRIVKTLPNRRQYELREVYPEPGITFESERTNKGTQIVTGMTLAAYNPIWRSTTESTVLTTSFTPQQLSYPISYPIWYDNPNSGDLTPIAYTGNWPAYPTIRVYAPYTAFTLTNQFGGTLSVYLSSSTDRILTFDPYEGFSIVDPDGTNKIDELTIESTFEGFSMLPGRQYELGYAVTGAAGGDILLFSYYEQFIGI